MLWLLAVIMFASCASSRKVEKWSSEQRRDSVVAIVKDSVVKSETSMDSTISAATTEQFTTGSMTDKGSNEETITERVTESTDAQGNKTTTTDRTIHRKGDYERNATYEARLKHQEEIISRMQLTIDSLVLSNKMNVGTHWEKNDSNYLDKEKNTAMDSTTSWWGRFKIQMRAFVLAFMVIVVGAQETGPFSMLSFDAMGVFSPDKVQPFGKARNGLAPSGGAACVILEPSDSLRFEDYEVSPVAELSGYGFSTNGTSICTPDAYQEEVAMIKAIESAGLDAGMIDVLLAHATGTEQGDAAEAEAIGKVFPESPYIVATKGMTGHECWMAGVSQAVQAAMMLNTDTIFGAATTAENAFPKLNLVMQSREYLSHHILCNAFGFGGTNSSFIISKFQSL